VECRWGVANEGLGVRARCRCGWQENRSWPEDLRWMSMNAGRRHFKQAMVSMT
jgi:hypothetical protein